MAGAREPIFLARDTYRRRRLIDAMRVLPVVGLGLFLAPLVGAAGARTTAFGGFYIFAVWFGLILGTFALVRRLARAPGGVGSDPLEPDHPPPPEQHAGAAPARAPTDPVRSGPATGAAAGGAAGAGDAADGSAGSAAAS